MANYADVVNGIVSQVIVVDPDAIPEWLDTEIWRPCPEWVAPGTRMSHEGNFIPPEPQEGA